MPNVKTAISLDQELFTQIEEAAAALKVSRSRVFALAAEDFVRRRQSAQITQQINDAYTNEAAEEDQEILCGMRKTHRRLASEAEW